MLAVTGYNFAPELMNIGERISNVERMNQVREGITRTQDTLPARMSEAVPNGPAAGHKIDTHMLDAMLDQYYAVRGWDESGRPTPETLEKLDLKEILAKA
jgi:aldehyde:ferredoxin oxidoreductase